MTGKATIGIEGRGLVGGSVSPLRLSVREGRIEMGRPADISWRLAPDELLIPAFHDHHTHLVMTSRPPQGPALDLTRSREECLKATALWLIENPGDGPVIGEGWDESTWSDPHPPTREEIDVIARGRPVALRRVCGHMAVVNSAAWDRIRPSGAEADSATGRLTESLALGLSTRWPPGDEDLLSGARNGQLHAAREGVVAVDEMAGIAQWRAFRSLDATGELWLRVDHAFPLPAWDALAGEGIRPGGGSGTLRAVGLKGFLDGSLGARTAAVAEPYLDRGTAGMLLWEEAPLRDLVRRGSRAGFAIRLHAIGARAISLAIGVLEEAAPAAGNAPHRIEHAEDLDPAGIARASRAGIALSMQPNFTARWQQPGGMYEAAIGRERARQLNPYRSVLERATLLFGSDTMPFGPLAGIPGAIRHPDPAQRLTAEEAIAAYAAGAIASGARADLVVLRVPGGDVAAALADGAVRVLWTASAGRTVWSDPGAAIPDWFLEGSR